MFFLFALRVLVSDGTVDVEWRFIRRRVGRSIEPAACVGEADG
jgi:hypothetical protein